MAFSKDDYMKWQQSVRAKTKQRGYGKDWQRIRSYKLKLQPFCELNRTECCTKE